MFIMKAMIGNATHETFQAFTGNNLLGDEFGEGIVHALGGVGQQFHGMDDGPVGCVIIFQVKVCFNL